MKLLEENKGKFYDKGFVDFLGMILKVQLMKDIQRGL